MIENPGRECVPDRMGQRRLKERGRDGGRGRYVRKCENARLDKCCAGAESESMCRCPNVPAGGWKGKGNVT